jgi:hypothetical protein
MFDIRSSEEADGETRMIGSGRRAGLGLCGSAVVVRALRASAGAPGLRPMKVCAILRTWEKSYWGSVSLLPFLSTQGSKGGG